MGLAQAFVRLRVDSTQVRKDTETGLKTASTGTVAKKAGEDTGKKFAGGMSSSLKSAFAGGAALLGIAGIYEGFKSLIDEGAKLQKSTLLLKAAEQSHGLSLKASQPLIQAAIDAGAKYGVTQDNVQNSLVKLINAGVPLPEALKVQQAAMNVAAVTGGDYAQVLQKMTMGGGTAARTLKALGVTQVSGATQAKALESASKLLNDRISASGGLAKFAAANHLTLAQAHKLVTGALAGNISDYNKLNIEVLPKSATLAQNLAQAQSILNSKFGKEGTAATRSWTGVQKQLISTIKDLIANIGVKLLPYLTLFATWLIKVGVPWITNLGRAIAPVAKLISGLFVLGIKTIIGLIQKIPGPVKLAVLAMYAFEGALLLINANPVIAIATAIILLVGATVKYWPEISRTIIAAWHAIYTNALAPLVNFFTKSVPHASDVMLRDTRTIWNDMYGATVGTAIRIGHDAERTFTDFRHGTANIFDGLRHDIAHIWDTIYSDTIGRVVHLVQVADDWIKNKFIGSVKNTFNAFVNDLPGIWNQIQNVVLKPVKYIVNTVYDGGIARFWNDVASPLHLPKLPIWHLKSGGRIPGFGGGDIVPAWIKGNGPAMLEPGEAVVDKNTTRAHRADLAAWGVPGFTGGGEVVAKAKTYAGHRYVWGGAANPQQGFDCSSFVNMILGMFGVGLPHGVRWNSKVHGPVAGDYLSWPKESYSKMSPGDLYVESNGGHVGFVTGRGTGFAALDQQLGTGPQSVPDSIFDIVQIPGVSGATEGIAGFIKAGVNLAAKGASAIWADLRNATADIMTGVLNGLVNPLVKKIPGTDSGVGKMLAQMPPAVIKALAAKIHTVNPNQLAPGSIGGGDPGIGSSAGEMANGKQLYEYLLKNLFGGNKIAAAGATASIWGESTWNPFAQGGGGRGLIGWTPISTISNSDFLGGMKTQLPAILRFVTSSGDSGVIAQMFRATSVAQAAQEWGKGVERFGVSDIHSQGIQLASSFMGKGGKVRGYRLGGMLPEDVLGIGSSGRRYSIGEGERVVPRNDDPLLAELRALRQAVENSSARTAAGVAKAVKAPAGQEAYAARAGAR